MNRFKMKNKKILYKCKICRKVRLYGIKDDNRLKNLHLTNNKQHEHSTLLKTAQKRIRNLEKILNV